MTGDALYQERLVRLARSAVGAGRLEAPDGTATLDNPLCGDRVTIDVQLREGAIVALAHRVRGCVLCEAAAALIGRQAVAASREELAAARASAAALLQSGAAVPPGRWADLEIFRPVRDVPSRHRCVLLPFDAAGEALVRAGV